MRGGEAGRKVYSPTTGGSNVLPLAFRPLGREKCDSYPLAFPKLGEGGKGRDDHRS